MSRRSLSDDEEALWSNVARSIKPLRPAKVKLKSVKPKSDPATAKSISTKSLPRVPSRAVPASPVKSPPLAPLDRRMKQRLARGRDEIEARIDLHGMTQN